MYRKEMCKASETIEFFYRPFEDSESEIETS